MYANSCINPFIYAAKYGEFQNGVRRMMALFGRNAQQSQQQQNIGAVQMASNQEAVDTDVT